MTNSLYILSFLLSLYYLKLIYSYIKGWDAAEEEFTKKNSSPIKVSILVSVRNEELFIKKCLKSLINQNYNQSFYEIILIDDFSEDKTIEIVSKFPQVKIIELSKKLKPEYKFKSNKKRAITIGVDQSSNNVIVTTDGDCYYPENWLKAIVQKYNENDYKLITGPVLYFPDNNFFSKFLNLDLVSLMGITCASIQNKKPNMTNGANMLFEKKVFFLVSGFKGNEMVASGDDVFLMQKINKRYSNAISFIKNKDSIVYTEVPKTFKDFYNQRVRWASKSLPFSDVSIKIELFFNYFFYLLIVINVFFLSFWNLSFLIIGFGMFLLKIQIDFLFFKKILIFSKKKKLIKLLIPIELVHLIYITLLGVFSTYGKYTWKGRKN